MRPLYFICWRCIQALFHITRHFIFVHGVVTINDGQKGQKPIPERKHLTS